MGGGGGGVGWVGEVGGFFKEGTGEGRLVDGKGLVARERSNRGTSNLDRERR